MTGFIDGLLMALFCVAALLFLRFWRRTDDRLFLLFSIAFWMMALTRFAIAWMTRDGVAAVEHQTFPYVVRLLSFSVILVAIIDKNRKTKRQVNLETRRHD